jgi:transcriptional regulator with XRE-family HTH domain
MPIPTLHLLAEARQVLRVSQRELAAQLGASERTSVRWAAGHSSPSTAQLRMLAELVFSQAPELATRIALATGTTLEDLGIARPPAAPAPPQAALVVDAVVCAAAEAMDISPRAVRPAIAAAFARAHALGLGVDTVHAALQPAAPPRKGGVA